MIFYKNKLQFPCERDHNENGNVDDSQKLLISKSLQILSGKTSEIQHFHFDKIGSYKDQSTESYNLMEYISKHQVTLVLTFFFLRKNEGEKT